MKLFQYNITQNEYSCDTIRYYFYLHKVYNSKIISQ